MITAMKDNGYFYAGQIMAMSIAHGGQSPCFLSELLYECLIKGPDNVKVKTEHITDEETRSQVQSVSIYFMDSIIFTNYSFSVHSLTCNLNSNANSCV